MAKHIHIHLPVRRAKAKDDEYKRDASGKFAEGDRVKVQETYGGKTGHIESTHGNFHVVKHDDGSRSSYHESNLAHHEDDDDDDSTHDAGTAHDPKNGQFTSGPGGASAHLAKEKAGWKKDADDPVAVHVPPPGAKVKNQLIEGHGVVKKVTGNLVTVAHTKTFAGKQYPKLDDFHASKLHPHEEASGVQGKSNSEIHQRWTAEHNAGKGAQKVNKHNPPSVFGTGR